MRCARSRTAWALKREYAAAVSDCTGGCQTRFLILVEIAANGIRQVLRLLRLRRVIARGLLGLDLDVRVGRYQFVRNCDPFDDIYALADQRIVFHVTHRDKTVDTFDAEPMDRVRHQLLETGVLHAGDTFGALEILCRRIATLLPLARVVDEEFRDLAQRPAFLAIVHDDAEAAGLAGARAFLDAVDQIGTAGADVRAEHIGAVALVVDPAGDFCARIVELGDVTEQINRRAADRRQKYLQIGPRHQLRKHAGGLLEQRAAQIPLGRAEAMRDAGQVPHRIDGDFDHRNAAVLVDDIAVIDEASRGKRALHFRQIEAGAGDGDGRTDVDAFGDFDLEIFRRHRHPSDH